MLVQPEYDAKPHTVLTMNLTATPYQMEIKVFLIDKEKIEKNFARDKNTKPTVHATLQIAPHTHQQNRTCSASEVIGYKLEHGTIA